MKQLKHNKRMLMAKWLGTFGISGIGWTCCCALMCFALCAGCSSTTDFPQVEITNDLVVANVYLPDPNVGYYRGTRFDWAGVIGWLQYKGHDYFGPWFDRIDATVHDFVFEGPYIVSGTCSGTSGPVEEFRTGSTALGFDEAKPGGTFIKIGVGVLRRPDAEAYDNYRDYEIVDSGKWLINCARDMVEFVHELTDQATGYGYVYTKRLLLTKAKAEMVIEHTLKNTGSRTIQSSVYNHNFFVLDNETTGPDFTITVPFEIKSTSRSDLIAIQGNEIRFLKKLQDKDVAMVGIRGFGDSAKDYDIRIYNKKVGAGVRITGDRPLSREMLWSIRSVLTLEPFIDMTVEPGGEFTWKLSYEFYTNGNIEVP